MESIRNYVKAVSGSSEDYLYGIYESNEHIGNIKLHTNMHHNLGDIGLIIGDKTKWGRGYATEAIKVLTKHGFDTLELHKISAGVYSDNIGSMKAFYKAGYAEDGRHERTYMSRPSLIWGDYVDEVIMSIWNEG
jgi:RimJ/RimL family protein N-acetyltransferase